MRLFTLILAFLFFLLPFTATAELYKWTDGNGVVHFSNTQPDPGADVKVMKEKKTVNERQMEQNRQQYRQSIESWSRRNQVRDIQEQQQEMVDQHNLSVYERKRDYHRQRARQYKALLENEKLDLERAEERYNEVKRESYSDSRRYRRRLDMYENRVENSETTIEAYESKVEYHEDQAESYQDRIDGLR